MSVSWRHMLAGAGIATAMGTVGLTAIGQSCGTCVAPPRSPPTPPSTSCCQTPRSLVVNVPGVNVATANVSVGATSTAVASASASGTASAGAYSSGSSSAGAGAYFLGGGGGYYSNPGVAQSTISNLSVDGGYDTRLVEEQVIGSENYCIDKLVEELKTRPLQAVCIDDKNTPHPASRVDGDVQVDNRYSGEVYRCVAGTHMQVTKGEMVNGVASFDTGETFSCAKGEALWHKPGGELECRTQIPERNCNERSLLRKFGPGVKLVRVSEKKTLCEPATRQTMTKVVKEVKVARPVAAGNLVLDGGVGQGY